MIINLPRHNDYEKIGKDCILQALSVVYDTFEKKQDEDTLTFNQRKLRNAIILIHQGVELLMKSEVSKKSPLLLIDNKRREWPTLPESKPKDFNDFNSLSGDDLLRTFFAVQEQYIDVNELKKYVEFYNALKADRNKLMHGIFDTKLEPCMIIYRCIGALAFFFEKTKWIQVLKEDYSLNPDYANEEIGSDLYYLYRMLKFILANIALKKLNEYLEYSLTQKRFYCDNCNDKMDVISETLKADWTYVVDNTVHCMVCGNVSNKDFA
jgi:hypothetical protein